MTPEFIAKLEALKGVNLLARLVKLEPPRGIIRVVSPAKEPVYPGPHFQVAVRER